MILLFQYLSLSGDGWNDICNSRILMVNGVATPNYVSPDGCPATIASPGSPSLMIIEDVKGAPYPNDARRH